MWSARRELRPREVLVFVRFAPIPNSYRYEKGAGSRVQGERQKIEPISGAQLAGQLLHE
jgi:hypothetical protein